MRQIIRSLVFIALISGILIYFYSFSLTEPSGYKKLRIETRGQGDGFALRMKPEGLEIWIIEKKVETKKVYPKTQELPAAASADIPITEKAV